MIEDDEGGQIESLMPRDDTNTLEAAVVRFEGAHAIAAIRKLPDLYREILTLRYGNDVSIREIASLIGESENVVSVRLHRGLKKLHAFLEAEQHEKI